MIGLTHKQRDCLSKHDLRRAVILAAIRVVSPVVTFRAHVRPALWCVPANENWPIEAWQ